MPLYGSIQGSYGIGRAPGRMLHSVLLIYDRITVDTTNLIKGMKRRGISVLAVQRDTYTGANPVISPTDYYAVILLDGTTYSTDLDVRAQVALVAYVRSGGKFIGSEWSAYQVISGRFASMIDLVLLQRDRASTGSITYAINPAYADHPIFAGFTGSSIVLPVTGFNMGPARQFVTDQPATVLATHSGETYAGIVVRELGLGKIVAFSHSGNYMAGVLSNPNVQRLYFNSIMW
jgi:hypothetical protein